ncbi:hypothetical protein [Tabrizicola oligotrophica]|uniref:Uncharacterized protein n=1 Tax=Tabrizicola oligotrophica TaxID=2710650 RepID=A0A6M0QU13_9RHOB|nr:hypothetical protein [Tabrizicola oligotrophica]NEY90905.1 hypothetical protein [Tabrizicola oligotrophica]
MKRLFLASFLLLAACGTPQEQCISINTRDLQVVDRLIRESESNIARGYAIETETVYEPDWIDCTPMPTAARPKPVRRMCYDQVPVTVRREVAIDLNAEAAKLQSLKAKRASLAAAAEGVIAACRTKYPE